MTPINSDAEDSELSELSLKVRQFDSDREWEQYHNVKSLAIALVLESTEILEVFRWTADSEVAAKAGSEPTRSELRHEIADVFINVLRLAATLDIDIVDAAEEKLLIDAEHYPVATARGNPTKYRSIRPATKDPET